MRMWMVDPALLCRQHLLGEHVELHMLAGTLRQGKRLDGFFTPVVLLQPTALTTRHAALVTEMQQRGYQHRSPLTVPTLALPPTQRKARVDVSASLQELASRCPHCRTLQELAHART